MSLLDFCEELAHQWGKWPEEVLRMPWVKLKRWLDVYLKRRRRDWKLSCALQALGIRGQSAALLGGGGGGGTGREISDDERAVQLAAAGFAVVRRPGPPET